MSRIIRRARPRGGEQPSTSCRPSTSTGRGSRKTIGRLAIRRRATSTTMSDGSCPAGSAVSALDASVMTGSCLCEDSNDREDPQDDDVLDATRRGGAIPMQITTYARSPTAHSTDSIAGSGSGFDSTTATSTAISTAMFLSRGVQPLAPPAVGTRRASMGPCRHPAYTHDGPGDAAANGRTIHRRGTVPPMAATTRMVGGYLSSTVDNLTAQDPYHQEDDTATTVLDIDTSNDHHQIRSQDEERRRAFEAKRKAEATRNPRRW
jgi:hypothetical protein